MCLGAKQQMLLIKMAGDFFCGIMVSIHFLLIRSPLIAGVIT
jgi:hypothetical protein